MNIDQDVSLPEPNAEGVSPPVDGIPQEWAQVQGPGGIVVRTTEPDATMTTEGTTAHAEGSWACVQYNNTNGSELPLLAGGRYWFHHGRQDVPPDVASTLLAQPGFFFVRDTPAPATTTG